MAKRNITVRFLEAVAARDISTVRSFATRKGFNPSTLAHVETVEWSTPEKLVGAMVIAASNADARMIRLLHSMGTQAGVNAAGDDPLLILAEVPERASVAALKALVQGAPVPNPDRLHAAFNSTLMHCSPVQTATQKVAVYCLMNNAIKMSNAQAQQISQLALLRYAGQPEFEPVIRLIAGNWRMQYALQQPQPIQLALTSYPLKPERLGLVRQHGLQT